MNFGLRIPSFALGAKTATLAEMGAYLRRAEDLGFDCAVSIDHLLLTPPAYACTWLEPVALLSALAGVTRTIRSTRPPGLLYFAALFSRLVSTWPSRSGSPLT